MGALPTEGYGRELPPPNVILLIGDGMDDQQITMARNYLAGAKGRLLVDELPVRSAVQVVTLDKKSPQRMVYVADSASGGTAIATGQATARGRVATDATGQVDFPTIIEIAAEQNVNTGVITTSSITDATPAAFLTHIEDRNCENPTMMQDAILDKVINVDCREDRLSLGGKGSIAEQIAQSPATIMLGGGKNHFKHFIDSSDSNSPKTVTEFAQEQGLTVITSAEELAKINDENAKAKRVLGLFANGNMHVRYKAKDRTEASPAKRDLLNYVDDSLGNVKLPTPTSCEMNPKYVEGHDIPNMTKTAIKFLSQRPQRFFLMVESALIDKEAHSRRPCGHIGELHQLLDALKVALEFAEDHGNTLVIFTSDHGHAAQIVPNTSIFVDYKIPIYTPGRLARLETPEGSIMAVNYATNSFATEEHTGVNVPLFANAPGERLFPPMLSQSEIFFKIKEYLMLR